MSLTLNHGARGFEVAVLQVQLKAWNDPDMEIDGYFGQQTLTIIKSFQRKNGLKDDGSFGPQTQKALADCTDVVSFNHNIRLIPQPTKTTCWAAATAMLTRSTPQAVIARTPKRMLRADGTLDNDSGNDQTIVKDTEFAKLHGLRCFPPMSWPATTLCAEVRRSPLGIGVLYNAQSYASGSSSPGHLVIFDAFINDKGSASQRTYFHVLDPSPPGTGDAYWLEYAELTQKYPAGTYRIYSR
jgi:hypothetical protein